MDSWPKFQIWLLDDNHELQLYRELDITSGIAAGDPGRSLDAIKASLEASQDPIWLENWSKHWQQRRDQVGRLEISTIYTGCGMFPFETAIITRGQAEQERKYKTWHEAQAGHDELLARYRLAVASE